MIKKYVKATLLGCVAASMIVGCDIELLELTNKLIIQAIKMTTESSEEIVKVTGGEVYESETSEEVTILVNKAIKTNLKSDVSTDIVFVIDTTSSMQDDIDRVKDEMEKIISDLSKTNPDWQVGLVEYRDKTDKFVSRTVQELTNDKDAVLKSIAKLKAAGGGDWCEHVYAGVDTALTDQPWRKDSTDKRIILMGDAPAHDYKDDERTFDKVTKQAKEMGILVNVVIPFCDKYCQDLASKSKGCSELTSLKDES